MDGAPSVPLFFLKSLKRPKKAEKLRVRVTQPLLKRFSGPELPHTSRPTYVVGILALY